MRFGQCTAQGCPHNHDAKWAGFYKGKKSGSSSSRGSISLSDKIDGSFANGGLCREYIIFNAGGRTSLFFESIFQLVRYLGTKSPDAAWHCSIAYAKRSSTIPAKKGIFHPQCVKITCRVLSVMKLLHDSILIALNRLSATIFFMISRCLRKRPLLREY